MLFTVEEERAIQKDFFVYTRFHSRSIYVTVFRTYRREAVIVTTTRLPVSLILSHVVVDNRTWPSVYLARPQLSLVFPAKCPDVPPGVTGSDITPPLCDFPP